ncbi:MAG: type II secretion system protein [Fimbriimonadales bacterium]|nr:type II secretion system protein [Fimbriimonadales bacterium]
MKDRARGLTLLEVAIAVTVIAAIAVITVVVLSRGKFSRDDAVCKTKLSQLNIALGVYRAAYGIEGEVVGAPERLGLPPSLFHLGLSNGMSWREYLPSIHCPRAFASDLIGGMAPVGFGYVPSSEIPLQTWHDGNVLLRGKTPVAFCFYHNPPGHDPDDPNLEHRLNILFLDGNVGHEKVFGMSVEGFRLDTYSRLRSEQ